MNSEDAVDMSHLAHSTISPGLNPSGIVEDSSYSESYSGLPQTLSLSNPLLLRSIFEVNESNTQTDGIRVDERCQSCPGIASSPLQMIAPSAAFQPPLLISPITKREPSTLIRMSSHSSSMFSSSPMGLISPPAVTSQHDVDDSKYSFEDEMIVSQQLRCRNSIDRLHGRYYERRRPVGPSNRPKPVAGRSGMGREAVIKGNQHLCSYQGCDRRFKRQEHKKRHERTVHEKNKNEQHYCWVSGCITGPFPRSDNLKAHLKKTD
jgi:hypothetical protein